MTRMLLLCLLISSVAASPQATPDARTTINRSLQELERNFENFHRRNDPSGPYPGYKLCRIMQRSIQRYYLGGQVTQTLNFTHQAKTSGTRKAISSASQHAWLIVKSDWNETTQNRPEYFQNELVPYGFQALELLVPGTTNGRVFIGVTDDHKNKGGLSAVCLIGFEVPH